MDLNFVLFPKLIKSEEPDLQEDFTEDVIYIPSGKADDNAR